jgi:lipopolysaccharide/colanic/teichoic acid biosynthesis glycosyltransferase
MKVLKRVFDIVTAGTALLLVSPLLIIVALAEKLTGQDVFFQQDRVGIGLQPFGVLKFTSMPKGSEKLGMLAAADDKRPTKLGRLLRKTKINEIPQLFNVLLGDMSMVGPRPLFAKQVAKYDEQVQQAIATVRPGVTGLGSLFFSAEDELLASVPEKDRFYDEVVQPQKGRIEIYYSENWSFWLDLEIVMLTGLAVLARRRLFPRRLHSLVDGFDAEVERFRQAHSQRGSERGASP